VFGQFCVIIDWEKTGDLGSKLTRQLESRFFIKETTFDLVKNALEASGVREKEKTSLYAVKLDDLWQRFSSETVLPPAPLARARAIFKWLWKVKPSRYKPQSHYRLDQVIDAQISPDDQPVGNCLGLTLLYNCLLREMDITAEALYLEDGFGRGPHVLTSLRTYESLIDVENILLDGFDYKAHLNNPARVRWGDRELVADIYLSRGNELFERGDFAQALKSYDVALRLNAECEKAHLNRLILLDKMKEKGFKGSRGQGVQRHEVKK
jgi:tetratricopeptide (TPR) repeat protein